MRVTRLSRIVGAACLAGSFMLVAAGPSSAAPPGWTANVVSLPATVHAGADAGYGVTVTNGGKSNISALYVVSTSVPTYVGGRDGAKCTGPGVPLKCTFGALSSGANVQIVVGFRTGSGSSFRAAFEANTTGVAGDKKGNSHGDVLAFAGTTALSSDKDFGGGFSSDQSAVGDSDVVGRNNVQSTSVTPPIAGVVATVQDGAGAGTFTCGAACVGRTLFGEWSKVTVGDGQPVFDAAHQAILFPVTVLVYGKALPKGATASSIDLVHVLDGGAGTEVLQDRCAPSGPTLNCVTVTQVGANFRLTGWVQQNGGFKGMG
jgi:hypothetical protein